MKISCWSAVKLIISSEHCHNDMLLYFKSEVIMVRVILIKFLFLHKNLVEHDSSY